MDEKKFLENFAKALGAEDTLNKLEQKEIQQEKMLRGMAKLLGTEELLEEIETKKAKEKAAIEEKKAKEKAVIEEKREKERKLLEQMNAALSRLVSTAQPEYEKIIEEELNEVIPFVNHPDKSVTEDMIVVPVEKNPFKPIKPKQITFEDLQAQPELPVDDFVTDAVKNLSKTATGQIQQKTDDIPVGFRRELDLIKKSIVDLHLFASRHSQHGGGGEVNLRYLDDIDRTSIADGLFLKYDAESKKFVFAAPSGSATTLEGLTDIVITDKSDGAIIQYDVNDNKYHIKQLALITSTIDSGIF